MNDEKDRPVDLRERLKLFALRVIKLCDSLPRKPSAGVIGRQLIRSGTSVGAQHREAHRARSTAEFISKVESALQELDETQYWLELLLASGLVKPERLANLVQESNELIAILVSSVRTAKRSRPIKGDATTKPE
jgi:four helix bundle protein